jgi:hypothetical protein
MVISASISRSRRLPRWMRWEPSASLARCGGARCGVHPHQQLGSGLVEVGQQPGRVEAAVGQQEPARSQRRAQPGGHRRLTAGDRTENRAQQCAGAGGDQGHQPNLGIARPPVGGIALGAVHGQVLRRGRDVQQCAVKGAHQQPVPPCRGTGRCRQQLEQGLHRSRPQAFTGVVQRRCGRLHGPFQPAAQLAPHPGPAGLGEQPRRQQQVDHHPRRNQTHPPVRPAARLKHRIDHLERHDARQLAQMHRRVNPTGTADDSGYGTMSRQGTPLGRQSYWRTTVLPGVPFLMPTSQHQA